ncbi:8603_t:CDS:2, partial [Ambispora leptoticha]
MSSPTKDPCIEHSIIVESSEESINNNTDNKKKVSSVQDVRDGGGIDCFSSSSTTFGTRLLRNSDDVFNHNAWDNVIWDEDQEKYAQERISKQSNRLVTPEDQERYHAEAAEYWNAFYQKNENRFFKDRNWLKIEFPELHSTTIANSGPKRVFEIGCGAGNTLFPLLTINENTDLFIYACDFSSTAVEVVKNNPEFNPTNSRVFVWDLTSTDIPSCIQPESIDIIVLIFVLSALRPEEWKQAVENVYKMLKPGGLILFRDYGRYDMVQLRFKEGRMLSENFYVRGDGTRSDWITQETPDGEIFYYNVKTQESIWDLPADDNESVTTTRSTTRDNSSVHGGSSTNNHHNYTHRAGDSPRSGSISALRPPRQLPEDWIQQPTEDGTTYYYLNTKTQEIRWTYPGGGSNGDTMLGNGNNNGDDNMDYNEPSVTMNGTSHSTANNNVVESSPNNSDDIGEIKDEEANESLSSNNINHHHQHHRTNSSRVEEAVEQYKQVREEDNDEDDKESIASSKGSRLSVSTFDTYQHLKKDANGDEIQLPPNWGSKMTPQGRIYYFNKLTDETTWSLDNVDMDTGQLLTRDYGEYEDNDHHHEISDIIDEHHQMNKLHIQPMAALPTSPPQRLERIRIMLYASGTVEKESPAIRQNCTLKICHRHILTSLSKLVLSTKVASGVWPPPDAAQKMKNDTDEVLVAVRQFIQAAEHTVEIKLVDPQILESVNGGAWHGNNLPPNYPNNGTIVTNGKYSNGVAVDDDENKGDSMNGAPHHTRPTRSLTPDLLTSLDHISRTVAKAITLLLNHIRKTMAAPRGAIASNAAFAPQLIAQTRQVVTQTGQLLNLIEDINLEDLDETSQNSIKEFKIVKQALYNSIAGLVMCTQHATDPSTPHNAMEQVLTSTNLVDKSVKDVIIATKFLVEEKDEQDQRHMQASMKSSSNTTASTLIINDDSRKSNGNAEDLYEDIDSDYGIGLPTVPEGDVINQQSNNNIG